MDLLRKKVVLIADDDNTSRQIITHYVQKLGYTALTAEDGDECIQCISEQPIDVILLDINMPKKNGFEVMLYLKAHKITTPVIMVTASNDIPDAVKCIKLGALEYLTKPLNFERLELGMRNALAESSLKKEVQVMQKGLINKELFHSIIGKSAAIKQTLEQVRLVMDTELNVLIIGESGTGKELFAQAIHNGSKRKNGPFVSINCAAISNNLADSILFGHVKGSFTGAEKDHIGFFEQADQGTLFLDEIGDMDSEVQAKILRVLQERKIRRVGEKTEKNIDIRIISATNRDFAQAIKNNLFREDLYYRLEEFLLFLPPLRERPEDIPILAKHFLDEFSRANNIGPLQFNPEAIKILENYQWPGNIRELRNAVQRSAVTRKGNIIETLQTALIPGSTSASSTEKKLPETQEEFIPHDRNGNNTSFSLEEHERDAIIKAYKASNGNLTRTARMLGIGRATLYRKLDKFGLENLKTG
ncbi:MAG: sigma-54 dependent transcriptional regulator [Chlorobiales bacterium]|nr:sigma-54 dependent transcriptional regulator [Chlorobiales bacterium]